MSTLNTSWENDIRILDERTAYFSIGGPTGHEIEDRLTASLAQNVLSACIADGHWGADTADLIADFWTTEAMPDNRDSAVEKTKRLEQILFELHGKNEMNAETDRTPEAAFISIAIRDQLMTLVGYGDCSLLVVRDGAVSFESPKTAIWLGAFSHLGLRDRKAVDDALLFTQVPLSRGDSVVLFTDGLDEWNHDEKASITPNQIASQVGERTALDAVRSLGDTAFSHHAMDDVSLLVHQIS